MAAAKALPTSSNRAAIFGRARVDDLVFDISAFGAAHNFFETEVGGDCFLGDAITISCVVNGKNTQDVVIFRIYGGILDPTN
jgi:hypothetical protein